MTKKPKEREAEKPKIIPTQVLRCGDDYYDIPSRRLNINSSLERGE